MAVQRPYLKITSTAAGTKLIPLTDGMVNDHSKEAQKMVVKSILPDGRIKSDIVYDVDGTEDPRIEIMDVVMTSDVRSFIRKIVDEDVKVSYFVQGLVKEESHTCVLKQEPKQGSKEMKETLIFFKR